MESVFHDYVSLFVLAILQGVTEFLPVSSSGHLVLMDEILALDSGMLFDLVLHFATLVSVVLYYRKDIGSIFCGCVREIGHEGDKTNLHFVGYLLAATVITGVIGIFLKDYVEHRFRSVLVVGTLLVVNALILLASRKRGLFRLTEAGLSLRVAILIGLAQGFAVLPGISRSGATITAALLMGVEPEECARTSFLLSIPVILGAVVLHIPEMGNMPVSNVTIILAAAAVASLVGYFSLRVLNRMLKKANFHLFAPYCFGVGLIAIFWGFCRM